MKHSAVPPRRRSLPIGVKVPLMAAFFVLLVWCVCLMREKLLKNANEMGMLLAESYAMEEENRTNVYTMLLSQEAMAAGELIEQGAGARQLQQQLAAWNRQTAALLGGEIIDPYMVLDGRIVAAAPWAGDEDYDYRTTAWYQKAVDAGGAAIYTDGYADAVTGKMVVTLACALNDRGDVLAFDILMENFHTHRNRASLPEQSSYFLFDSQDRLLYYSSDLELDNDAGRAYMAQLVQNIRAGRLESHDSAVRDVDGVRRTVYYYEMNNGWLSVITIPIEIILQDGWDSTVVLLAVLCVLLALVGMGFLIRGALDDRRRRQTEESLQILGDSYYAIYRIDLKSETYRMIKCSPDVREAMGIAGSYQHLLDTVKQVVDERTHEQFEKSLSAANIRALIARGVYDFGGDYQRNFGGEYKWVNIQVLYSRALHLDEVLLAFREIDSAKRVELQQRELLEAALAAAEKTVEQKAMFFSNASHDMRTPLNAIIGLSRLAQGREATPQKVQEYLAKIESSGRQLLTLVNDVLDMSRLEHGKGSTLNYVPMNIAACVREHTETFREQAARQQKQVRWQCQVDHPVVVCDPARLGQILNNLISNAVKYSGPGAQVDVTLREVNHRGGHSKYQLEVADTGFGMSEEFQQHLFEPFAREETFTSRKISGTGLGMPIVKTLVQQMSGELTVRSALGKGTTFTITLPLQTTEEEPPAPEQGGALPQQDVLRGRTILLAEDNEINMEVASECLGLMGARVLQAWNGREAVEAFASSALGEIDAILMDMQMPVLDGCGAAEAIRALDRSDAAAVPIIAVTANVFAEDIARTTAAGMNGHIAKPIDFGQLQELLRGLLG